MGTDSAPNSGSGVDGGQESDSTDGAKVDFSPALHTAGHETEDLGFEGVEDSAPVLHDDDSEGVDLDHRFGADIATRGADHH
jgi:hypothetical protein